MQTTTGISRWTVGQNQAAAQPNAATNRDRGGGGGYSGRGGGVVSLSSLLSANLSLGYGGATTAAASNSAWSHSLATKESRAHAAGALKAASIQRTYNEQKAKARLHSEAIAAAHSSSGSSGMEERAQTARATTSQRLRRAVAAGLGLPNAGSLFDGGGVGDGSTPFRTDAKLLAMDAQASQYRARIALLERQLHVAQAAAMAAGHKPVMPSTAASSTAAGTLGSGGGTVDHFPLPAATAVDSSSARRQQHQRSDSGATVASFNLDPAATSAASRATTATATAALTAAAASSAVSPLLAQELSTLRIENSGLHEMASRYETALEESARERQALRADNARLRAHVNLASNFTGLLQRAEELEQQTNFATHAGTSSSRGSTRGRSAQQQSEEKEPAAAAGSHAASASSPAASFLASVPGLLKHSMAGGSGSISGAPQWLNALLAAQAAEDAANAAHGGSSSAAAAAPSHSGSSSTNWEDQQLALPVSPMATPSRVAARAAAFRYIHSSLHPSLNIRDRALIVLFDEMGREHAWISGQVARQTALLQALVAFLRKQELGLESAEDARTGSEYFRALSARENEEAIQSRAEALAERMVEAKIKQLRKQGALQQSGGSTAAASASEGLVTGSAGAVPSKPVSGSHRSALSTSSSSSAPAAAPRNAPVQVEGGGSAVIALGSLWVPDAKAEAARPFYGMDGRAQAEQALHAHSVRFVTGASAGGREVPLSARQIEEEFQADKRNQHKGFSDSLGGTVNVAASTAVAALTASSAASNSGYDSDDSDSAAHESGIARSSSRSAAAAVGGGPQFRERDGALNLVPASVRRWSQVEQLEYLPHAEHLMPGEVSVAQEMIAKRRATAVAAAAAAVAVAQQKPGSGGPSRRNYTQTALGALSESVGESSADLDPIQVRDPFAPEVELVDASTVSFLARKAEEDTAAAQTAAVAAKANEHANNEASRPSSRATVSAGGLHMPLLSIPPAQSHSAHLPSASPTSLVPSHSGAHAFPSSLPGSLSMFSLQNEFAPLSSLKLLYDLLRFISFKLTHLSQLRHVVHVVRKLVGSDRVTLWFVDGVRGHIWSNIGTAVTNEIRVKLGVGIAGGVAASGRSVTMTNATFDQRFLRKVESGTDYVTKAVMAIPLKTPRDATFAVLQIMNKERATNGAPSSAHSGYFTRTDEILSHIVCAHLAQNLWASEMFQVALREKIKTQDVFAHAESLLSCSDVREMLSSLCNRIRLLMDADYSILFALSSNKSQLEKIAAQGVSAGEEAARLAQGSRKGRRAGTADGKRAATAAGSKREARDASSASWEDASTSSGSSSGQEPLREELLTVTESCAPHIALLIPGGYASDRFSDTSATAGSEGASFKFSSIRVPLSSNGLATQSLRNKAIYNVQDTRLDPRFNPSLDDYVSDTVGSGGPGGTQQCTRAFVSIPIVASSSAANVVTGDGPSPASLLGSSHPSYRGVDGVLVLGKLVASPFAEWQIQELDSLKTLLWMGIKRYTQDREVNLRMQEKLAEVQKMVANLDGDAADSGTTRTKTKGWRDQVAAMETQTSATPAIAATDEGAQSGDAAAALPSLAEYQRSRILMPAAPSHGSTLADALWLNESTRSEQHPHGTIIVSEEAALAAVHNIVGAEATTKTPVAVAAASNRSSARSSMVGAVGDKRASLLHQQTVLRGAEKVTMQREVAAAAADDEAADEPDDDPAPSVMDSKAAASASAASTIARKPQPPPGGSRSGVRSGRNAAGSMLRPVSSLLPDPFAPISAVTPTAAAASGAPPSLSIEIADSSSSISSISEPVIVVTQYKPAAPVLAPHGAPTDQERSKLEAFHTTGLTSGARGSSSKPTSPSAANGGSGQLAPVRTVSRIALRNLTDDPHAEANKEVTYV